MIENVLNLEEKAARRVMVPRPDIVYLSLARPLDENLRIARQAGHTRFPLCEDDLSTVIGLIHVKDIFRSGAYQNGRTDLRQLARKIPFFPVTLAARPALARISTKTSSSGDVARRIWKRRRHGDSRERAGRAGGPHPGRIRPRDAADHALGENIFEVDASCPLDVLTETCHLQFPETDAETAGGLVLDLLGRLGKPGDSVTVDGHRLTILRADPTRIRKIRVEPVEPEGITSQFGESSHPAGDSSSGV